jgi:hypothetical protein
MQYSCLGLPAAASFLSSEPSSCTKDDTLLAHCHGHHYLSSYSIAPPLLLDVYYSA